MAPPHPPLVMHTFVDATKVKQLSSHTYEAFFHDDWCIGSVPHGGYVSSTFLQVAKAHFGSTLRAQNQPDTISLHVDFLRRTQAGPAFFTVVDAKLGRQASVITVSLSQPHDPSKRPPFAPADAREEVLVSITQSNMAAEEGITLNTGWTPEPAPPRVDLTKLAQDTDALWAAQKVMPFGNFRKASQKLQWHFPRGKQVLPFGGDQWSRFSNGERFTAETLGFLCDMFTMPVERVRSEQKLANAQKIKGLDQNAAFWYPTVLLNLDVKKALPKEGVEWLFTRARVKQLKNGRMDLDITIMDAEGDIVALSSHICYILPAARNLAKRRDTSKI